ncbi:MAG TPA: alpha/beta fold hydrolase [Caulobacteraceae bacterium]|jgi:pimeloyl-ACP methyl ester carboxylesterase|nr:alpha/beta fold hydrolase [Caulobacteraceae bacterium]
MTAIPVQLRLGSPDDVDAIRALTLEAYAPWVALIGREPLPMTADYEAAVRAHRFDLAFHAGELVGLIETLAAPDHLLVVNVAVATAHQSASLGRRLLGHAEVLAREQGLATLRLYTNARFERNISIYLRLGYRIEREETTERGVTVHMVKTIDLQARRLLFLPGAGADPAFWRPLGDQLPPSWDKHYFGWPGLGDQPSDPAVNSIGDLAAMVEAELWPGPVDLLAQSMGGVVAMLVALRNPGQVRRVVLTATSGGVDTADLTRFDWRANYRREYPGAAAWITEERIDLTAQIPALTCPTLLLWGDHDPISPVAVGERLLALLPDARLHVAAGGEHDLAVTQAHELAPIVAAHLR